MDEDDVLAARGGTGRSHRPPSLIERYIVEFLRFLAAKGCVFPSSTNAGRRRRRVAPPPRGRGVGRCGDLAANAERKVDRRARRAFRVDCDHVEREPAGVDVLERERRDEGAGG